jgi:hypothetical protein
VVFTVTGRDAAQTYAALLTLRTSAWIRLIDGVTGARAALPGYLLAQRAGEVVAAPFENRTILSFPAPVETASAFAVSATGSLAQAAHADGGLQLTLDWGTELARRIPRPIPALPR